MKCKHIKNTDLKTANLEIASNILATAFSEEPVHKLIFPVSDQESLIDILRDFFHIYVNLANKYGGILITKNNAGVLVYFRPELAVIPKEELANIDNQLHAVCGSHYSKVITFIDGLEQHHPKTFDHYYISLLAVTHSYRGRGLVNDLFSAFNNILDKAKLPCYAECTRYSTRTLIRRWGYMDLAFPISIHGFPKLYPVIRYPQINNVSLHLNRGETF
ncbi:MAG: hypothetical protein P6H82_03035 [Candidatus Arsenophonus melophagi]|nr:hypothetical protein [Candidatus Arsenophonus melophagi]